jgi:hypothetical protein
MEVSWNRATPISSSIFPSGFSMKETIQLLGIPHLWKPLYEYCISYPMTHIPNQTH